MPRGRDLGTLRHLAGLWAVLGLGIFPGHPQHPLSSLIWGFPAPMAAPSPSQDLSQPGPLPAHGPGCSQALPLRARGCAWDFLLLSASSPFTPIYTPVPDAAPTFPGAASCSPLPTQLPEPGVSSRPFLQPHSRAGRRLPPCPSPAALLFPLSQLPPHPPRCLPHTAPAGGSSSSKISA